MGTVTPQNENYSREPLSTAAIANAGPDHEQADRAGASETPLLPGDEAAQLRHDWDAIQAGFVDEPRRAVEQADHLVATAMQKLADNFANERTSLEQQWDSGDDVSTEDLRVALQRYRSFFNRLLSA